MRVPVSVRKSLLRGPYARHLHRLVCAYAERKQSFGTYFLRNRAELQLLRNLLDQKAYGSKLNICVLACSKGAEVYSFLWTIRSARPDLHVTLTAVDISCAIVEFAKRGVYSLNTPELAKERALQAQEDELTRETCQDQPAGNMSMFERLTGAEIESMFDTQGHRATVKPWLSEGIIWRVADAGAPELLEIVGPQDIVVANRFLCHMDAPAAAKCLRNIARLVKPGGYLFISGVDLDVRTNAALGSGWRPVTELMREIHEGDSSLRNGWPLHWWGLEPFDDRRPDWQIRYASVFQLGEPHADLPEGALAQPVASRR